MNLPPKSVIQLKFVLLLFSSTLTELIATRKTPQSNILMLTHPYVASHNRLFYKLAEDLERRGHRITVLRWAATEATASVDPPKSVQVIEYLKVRHQFAEEMFDSILWKEKDLYIDVLGGLWQALLLNIPFAACNKYEQDTNLQEILKQANFTSAIIDPHGLPCFWAIANHLKLPYITLSPSALGVFYLQKAAATPTPFSYVPSVNEGSSDQMFFWRRVVNVFDHLIFATSAYWALVEMFIKRNSQIFNDTRHRPLMVLFLSHQFIEFVQPQTRTLIQIGMRNRVKHHVSDTSMDGHMAKTDVTIVFSMTTMGKNEMMSTRMRNILLESFASFPEVRFIWRTVNPDLLAGKLGGSENVKFVKWFNQTNVFANAKTQLLITHGGIASILEAVRHGLPVLAIPLGMEHPGNVARAVHYGVAQRIAKFDLTTGRLTDLIAEMIQNPRFTIRAQKISRMQDDEQSSLISNPLIWFTEYAFRNGHKLDAIKAHGELMPIYEYFHLDYLILLVVFLFCSAL